MTFQPRVAAAASGPATSATRATRRWTLAASRRHSRGQSVVEFALVLVPMMLLLLGAIQFGVIWATQVGVTNAVRDAARAASLAQPKADAATGTVTAASEQSFAIGIRDTVLVPALGANVPFYNAAAATTKRVCYSTFNNVGGKEALQATVTVVYGHPIFIPLLSGILGNSIATTTVLTIPVGIEQPYELPDPPSANGSDANCVQP